MTAPTHMPRYTVTNDGMGPYAIFYCDRDQREYRSTASVQETIKDSVKRGALGGLLRNVPVVGWAAANQVENQQWRTSMDQNELNAAWGQVTQYFRECPTCHQIVCVPDFDEVSGFCNDDSPRRGQIAEAQAQQAASMVQGFANAFGVGNAMRAGMANAAAAQGAAAAGFTPCANCGTPLAPGTKFCANCGTPVAQASNCKNCGTQLAPGTKFCANCGTAVSA